MKRLLALFLVIVMTVSAFAGCQQEESASIRKKTETEKVTEPAHRESLVPELGEDEDILTFRYEEKYLDLYYEKLEQLEQAAMDGDLERSLTLQEDCEELAYFIYDQATIAEILHYCNTKDEEASDLHLEMIDISYNMSDVEIMTMRRIYQSDCTIKDELFADWTEEDIAYLEKYTSEVKDIQQREEEILVDVREMTDEEMQEDIGPYYSEIVVNNNRTAEIFGYENFYEYAYRDLRDRDYGAQEVERLRSYVKDYCIVIYEAALEQFYDEFYDLSTKKQDKMRDLLTGSYDDSDYLEEYLEALPEEMGHEMLGMLDGYVVFPKGSKAKEGAFTTLIGGHPFCYFSRGYKSATTVAHEMGHYYGGLYAELMDLPLDLAEIQSQGNEWLMLVYSAEEMDEDVFNCYLNYRFANDVATILAAVIIDDFEERVYTTEGVEDFEAEDFDRLMEEVCEDYGGIEKLEEILDLKTAWRQVAVEQPGYYISYAVSMVPSLDIFFCASEDWEEAVEIYKKLTEELAEDPAFLDTIEGAGLATPFEKTLFAKLLSHYELVDVEEEAKTA